MEVEMSDTAYTAYAPAGRTQEDRMRAVIDRRAAWLNAHPEAPACVIIVHPNNVHNTGFWLSHNSVKWDILPKGGPALDEVWFVDSREMEATNG
jgi:hypothetical protein